MEETYSKAIFMFVLMTIIIVKINAKKCAVNPCQNGGTCHLDAKQRAVCSCTNGWSSNHCDKSNIHSI